MTNREQEITELETRKHNLIASKEDLERLEELRKEGKKMNLSLEAEIRNKFEQFMKDNGLRVLHLEFNRYNNLIIDEGIEKEELIERIEELENILSYHNLDY